MLQNFRQFFLFKNIVLGKFKIRKNRLGLEKNIACSLKSAVFWFQDFAEFPLKDNTAEGLAATGQPPETDSENSEEENENEMQRR